MKTKKAAARKLTIGLDLGNRRHHVCVLDAAGEIVAREVVAKTPEVLTSFYARYRGATIVMETGTHRPWVSRLMAKLGHKVIGSRGGAETAEERGWLRDLRASA